MDMIIPIERSSGECENAGGNCDVGHKVTDATVNFSKRPVIIQHVDKVEEAIEDC